MILRKIFKNKWMSGGTVALAAAFLALSLLSPVRAEAKEVSLAQQFGVSYLPLMMMRHHHLVAKHAKALGLDDVTVKWHVFSNGTAMNTALLSGSLNVAAEGVGPLLKIWDKTQGLYDVHAIAAINTMPLFLNTNNPKVHSIKDFTDKDRIALPAVKVSIQAITLQMAVAKAFGIKHYDKLDHLTVSMKHPDGMAALLSGHSQIDAHLTSPPYQYQELIENPKVHTVLNSYDVLGGPATFNVITCTKKFRDENPKLYQAIFAALQESLAMINKDKHAAAKVYIEEAHSKLPEDLIYKIITKPGVSFTLYPKKVMEYAKFMHETGSIDDMPASVKDVFFPDVFEVKKQ